METNSTNKLITITENKGIKFLRGDKALFKKYSYFRSLMLIKIFLLMMKILLKK